MKLEDIVRALLVGLCLAVAAVAAPAAAQNEVQVSARVTAGVLRLGDSGQVMVSIENGSDARIVALPEVKGLRFGKPELGNRSSGATIINGRIYSQRSLRYDVPFRPESEGDFEIGPIRVEVDGRPYETKPLRVTVVKDITGADFGYLEVHASAAKVIEGQPFSIELTFGWDEERTGKISFAELNLPWWDSLPGAIEVEGKPIPQESRVEGIRVNGNQQVTAEQVESQQRDGRRMVALRIQKSFLPTRSGVLEFPTSFFEFGRQRQVSFFDTRRDSHFVEAKPFTLEVVPLPTEGQPLDFSGAVGTLTARANADARDVRVGDSIKLTVEWTGQGNLEYFRAPDPSALEAFRGFRVYGTTEEKSFERRKVVYDLAPLSTDVQSIPALPLSVFEPASGQYQTIATAPIPIRVRALEKGSALADDEKRFERDIQDIDARAPLAGGAGKSSGQDRFLLGALVSVPLLGLVLRARARRGHDPAAPLERRRRRALKELARALARDGAPAAQQAALLEFLGARTRERVEAWNGRDFAAWVESAAPALAPELRAQTRELLGRLEAAVWGGAPPVERERVAALARALQEGGL